MKVERALVFVMLAAALATAQAEKPRPDPLLDRPISSIPAGPPLEKAIHQAEKETGFKVTCPEDTKRVVQETRALGLISSRSTPIKTVRDYFDNLCMNFALNWKFNAREKTITLDLPWRVADPRPASKLFRAIWKPEAVPKMDAESIWEYRLDEGHLLPLHNGKPWDPALVKRLPSDAQWQPAFSALLSKEENFPRAAKARQRAELQTTMQFPNESLPFMEAPVLESEMVDTKGHKYFCVFFRQDAEFSFGSGSLSYYWFRSDGTLVGAGLMNTGHRCFWIDGKVDDAPAAGPSNVSEFVMKLGCNDSQFSRRFFLDSEGLKFSPRSPAEYFNGMGESLLVPPADRPKRPDSVPPELVPPEFHR